MTAQQLRNSILQSLLMPQETWEKKTLIEVVDADSSISYGIVQPGENYPSGVPVIRPIDLIKPILNSVSGLKRTNPSYSDCYKRTILSGKEILFCVRGTTGLMSLSSEELIGCNVTRGISPLKISNDTTRLYAYYYLLSPFSQSYIREKTKGAALKQINISDLKKLPICIPPLAEQKRIVAKLEELLPLVEKYGKAQEELDKLNKDLPQKLRQSILQDAIQGKLVPQDPAEGNAEVVLRKIKLEKADLVSNKILKKVETEDFQISSSDLSISIPERWRGVRLREICALIDGERRSGKYICLDAKFLRGKSSGDYLLQGKYVEKDSYIILVDGENSGEVFVTPIEGYLGSTFKRLWISREMYAPYVMYVLRSFKETLRNDKRGAAIPHLNKDLFYNFEIGIPPLAEQKRIVAKIEELFAEIDKLK